MDCPSLVYYLKVEEAIKIEELGLTLEREHFPRLFKLAKDDYKRLLTVLSAARKHGRGLGWGEILASLEANCALEIMGEKIEALTLPAIYFALKENHGRFERFFEESVKLWEGDKRRALLALEEAFEKDGMETGV